ncbi:MAG: AmmeMemoRadiSam system radical SAM enzyme [Nitrososphaerota archaeon]|nr:AmmeMemoRadiSam system radical SAM enzyme [Nitrososphaerota archaeon]
MKEAMLYSQLPNGVVECNLCYRRCRIASGHVGFCGVRRNVEGTLYSLVYGKAIAANVDPIEKKPLFHYYPGSAVMSIATVGCNFRCKFCDNWVISQSKEIEGFSFPPEKVVSSSLRHGCHGISYTYTEPTIFFEYAYDTAKLAKEKRLFNTFVTNGYMTPEAVRTIAPYLDAATVDFKGSGDPKFYREFMSVPDPEPIFETLKEMKRCGIFIEVTNLIVTKYGDDMNRLRGLASRIVEVLGKDVPFHVLRFHPDYQLFDVSSTPVSTLEKAAEIAKEEGLKYVYIGNVPGHELEHTYCPSCGLKVIERFSFDILRWNLKPDNTCPKCGERMNIIGSLQRGGNKWLSLI